MGRPRSELQDALEAILGSANVYFQPPPTFRMAYPCIVYKRDRMGTQFADNSPYALTNRYLVTVIDPDPDSAIPNKVAAMPMCLMNRAFPADNLNHDVFILYF